MSSSLKPEEKDLLSACLSSNVFSPPFGVIVLGDMYASDEIRGTPSTMKRPALSGGRKLCGHQACHSANSTVIPSGPERNTSLRSWKSMTSFRSLTPLLVNRFTSASKSFTAKQMWL